MGCPKCNQKVDHLLAVETRETELKATYDKENEELTLEPTEEWRGNPLGEQTKIVFSCPICKKQLFDSEEPARIFLGNDNEEPDTPEGTQLVQFVPD